MNKPAYVFVEATPVGEYRISTTQAESDRDTRRLYEITVGSQNDLALRVATEPFLCDPFTDWEVFPQL